MTALKCFLQSGMLSSENVFFFQIVFFFLIQNKLNKFKKILVISRYNDEIAFQCLAMAKKSSYRHISVL